MEGVESVQDTAAGDTDFALALAQVIETLAERFAGSAPRAVVSETVWACAERFRDVRVATFVPLLVERDSAERLRALAVQPSDTDLTDVEVQS